jgi:hypothetical protein
VRIDAVAQGIDELRRDLRRLGGGADHAIMRNLKVELRKGVAPTRRAVRARAKAILPKRGGLNIWMARTSVVGKLDLRGTQADLFLIGSHRSLHGKTHSVAMDEGHVRHPTFGRPPWVSQIVPPRFFTDAALAQKDEYWHHCLDAVEAARRQVNL